MRISPWVALALVISHIAVGVACFFVAAKIDRTDDYVHFQGGPPHITPYTVLDGDTVLIGAKAVHVRGMDAPELGLWAKCWAEAALARNAKDELNAELMTGKWKPFEMVDTGPGTASALFLNGEGFDLVDDLRVAGYAAATDKKWDWCGSHAGVHSVQVGEKPPMGPQLWWPSGDVYDARAND